MFTQTIQFHTFNKSLIIENLNKIIFIDFEFKENKINIKSLQKSKLGNEQSKLVDIMDIIN